MSEHARNRAIPGKQFDQPLFFLGRDGAKEQVTLR
jgi:hypothetical protein